MHTKHFWKTFFTDKFHLTIQALWFLFLEIIIFSCGGHLLPFAIGFWGTCPFGFYFFIYRPKQKRLQQESKDKALEDAKYSKDVIDI